MTSTGAPDPGPSLTPPTDCRALWVLGNIDQGGTVQREHLFRHTTLAAPLTRPMCESTRTGLHILTRTTYTVDDTNITFTDGLALGRVT